MRAPNPLDRLYDESHGISVEALEAPPLAETEEERGVISFNHEGPSVTRSAPGQMVAVPVFEMSA